jgi:hypothetical protein
LFAIALLAGPGAAFPATYRLELDSASADIKRISLGETVLLRDRPLSEVRFNGERIPGLKVDLRDPVRGRNVVEVEYRAPGGIQAQVVRRDGAAKTTVVTVHLPGTSGTMPAVGRIQFEAPDAPAERATLGAAGREEILGVVRRYHAALVARDRAGVLAEYGPMQPEHRRTVERGLDTLFANPSLVMRPLDLAHLEWIISVDGVELRRDDGAPVLGSAEAKVGAAASPPGSGGVVAFAPPRLYFRMDRARWKLVPRL